MRKSSVYLSDALKGALAATASATGRSEAELIRDAVEREVRRATAGSDQAGRWWRPPVVTGAPCLVGVGIGPGDPGLVTAAARQVLVSADRVLTASADRAAVGRAEAVVRSVEPDVAVERLVLDISADDGARRAAYAAAAERVAGYLDAGEVVAFAVLGDPNLWSPWPALRRAVAELRPEAPEQVAVVPGVMAWQALAARTTVVVAEGAERVVLTCLGDDPVTVTGPAAEPGTTVVVYRGGASLGAVAAALGERAERAVAGELLGQPGERAVPLSDPLVRPSSYLATTIVPARRPQ